ncbi:hypothetical protein Cantr_04623 [Candida viswanathii]|uniref:PI31 proteasome regulator C-terminal domain-containing protein n=1 Tax=Candida viswanathii TaxID=5486 RepID=A0A367XMX4_9ASCO|nr:hypothetical protein Cantr_04623 [Candida viswanathii]
MTVDNYFQLTFELVSRYVNQIYPSSENFKLVQVTDEPKLKQSKLFRGDEQILFLSFTEISEIQSLVNLLNIDGRLDNALINWEWFDLETIAFPIQKSQIPQDLINKFNTKFRLIVDDEKVSSIFSHSTNPNPEYRTAPTSQPQAQSEGPIIEEHTDSESVKSPTPETPYHPGAEANQAPFPHVPPPAAAARPDNSIFKGPDTKVPVNEMQPHGTRGRPADMPDFDDEYEIRSPPAPVRDTYGQSDVTPIGSDDLNPPGIGAHPTLKPYLDPLGGGQGGQHQGMYPDPDHPMFGHPKPPPPGSFGGAPPPPGARYDDPFGPPGL